MNKIIKSWTNSDLVEYISLFKEKERENILKQILENDLLKKFLDTTEGRLILGHVIDSIAEQTMKIVRLCIDGNKEMEEIINAAQQISLAYNFMYKLANIALSGKTHEENLEKRKVR